jgi:hypothetical protein
MGDIGPLHVIERRHSLRTTEEGNMATHTQSRAPLQTAADLARRTLERRAVEAAIWAGT